MYEVGDMSTFSMEMGFPIDIGIMIVKPDNYDHFSLAGFVARSL